MNYTATVILRNDKYFYEEEHTIEFEGNYGKDGFKAIEKAYGTKDQQLIDHTWMETNENGDFPLYIARVLSVTVEQGYSERKFVLPLKPINPTAHLFTYDEMVAAMWVKMGVRELLGAKYRIPLERDIVIKVYNLVMYWKLLVQKKVEPFFLWQAIQTPEEETKIGAYLKRTMPQWIEILFEDHLF